MLTKRKRRPQGNSEQTKELIGGDRRGGRRYDLDLKVRWFLLHRNKLMDSGSGSTVNLSSRGLLLEIGRPLPVGKKVSLAISWPVLLHDEARLQLRVQGRVVRSDGELVAVRTLQHEFRTAGAPRSRMKTVRLPLLPMSETCDRTAAAFPAS